MTLAIADLTVRYGARTALDRITCTLPSSGFVGLLGPNGSGKSTLLRAILGWQAPARGSVQLDGRAVAEQRARFAYLPQRDGLDLDFPATVELVVQLGRFPRLGWWRGFTASDHAAVETALDELGLTGLRRRPLAELSGGQRQRVLLARALAQGADVVLLDAPLTGLDATSRADLLDRLAEWGGKGRLVLAVLHDLDAVRSRCSHALLLDTRLVAAGPPAEACSAVRLAEAYGRAVA